MAATYCVTERRALSVALRSAQMIVFLFFLRTNYLAEIKRSGISKTLKYLLSFMPLSLMKSSDLQNVARQTENLKICVPRVSEVMT